MKERDFPDVVERAEDNFIEAYANLDECTCYEEHRLHVALSEQRGNPKIFWPDHRPIKGAYCAVHDRCR